MPTRRYPSAQDVVTSMILHKLGKALEGARNDKNFTLKGKLTGLGANCDKYLLGEAELRVIGCLINSYSETDERKAKELQVVIDKVLRESGNASLLAENGIRVLVRGGGITRLSAIFTAID